MAYSSVTEVRKMVEGVAGDIRNKTPAQLDDAQIQYAIDSADAQIDATIRRRYELPFVTVPALIRTLSIAIASYNCFLMFMGVGPVGEDTGAFRMWDKAFKILEGLRSGKYMLDSDEVVELGSELDSFVFNDYTGVLFGTEHIFGYPEGYVPPDRTYY